MAAASGIKRSVCRPPSLPRPMVVGAGATQSVREHCLPADGCAIRALTGRTTVLSITAGQLPSRHICLCKTGRIVYVHVHPANRRHFSPAERQTAVPSVPAATVSHCYATGHMLSELSSNVVGNLE